MLLRSVPWALAGVFVCAPAFAAEPPVPRRAVVVSIDGLSPSAYLDPDSRGLAVPNLRALAAGGAYASAVVGVLPTNTYPTHTTLLTGVPPALHGIAGNRIFDPLFTSNFAWYWYAREIRTPTLLAAARAAGLRSAAIAWPVTVGAPADLLVPEFWRTGSQHPHDLELARALATPGFLDRAEAALGRPLVYWWTDAERTELALAAARELRPELLLVHYAEHDKYLHQDGVGSESSRAALERIDAELGRLRAGWAALGLEEGTLWAIVSDHGFLPTTTELRPNTLLRDAGLVDIDADGKVTGWRAFFWTHGGTALLKLADPADAATLERVRALLAAKATEPGSRIRRLLDAGTIAALGADAADTPFGLDAESGSYFQATVTGGWTAPAIDAAGHGFAPDRPEMHAALILAGAGVSAEDLGTVPITAIAATVARWLGLELDPRAAAPLDVAEPARVPSPI
jgi:hypothetical protein